MAATNLMGGTNITVLTPTLVDGRYWRVLVLYGYYPGGHIMLDISTKDGTIAKRYPGM